MPPMGPMTGGGGPPGSMLGLGGMMGTPNMGETSPGDPIADPNANPALGPMTNGGPEPDQATLEQLISILKVLGSGGAASGMPAGPGGMGLPMQAPPGGAAQTGQNSFPAPRPPGSAELPPHGAPGMAGPGMAGGGQGLNPLLLAMGR